MTNARCKGGSGGSSQGQSGSESTTSIDREDNGNTVTKPATQPSTQPQTEPTTQQPTTEPSTQPPNTRPPTSSGPSEGGADCKKEGFAADPKNCKKFIRCVSNGQGGYTKYEFTCADGTAWDNASETCNYEDATGCAQPVPAQSSSQTTEGTPGDREDTTTTQRPTEPATQSTTKAPAQPATQAPTQATTKAPTQATTKAPTQAPTQATTTKKPSSGGQGNGECRKEGFDSVPNDCKKFIRCVSNGQGGYTKYEFTCADGTAWDNESETCNFQDATGCAQPVPSTQSPPTTSAPTEGNREPGTETTAAPTTSQPKTTTTSKPSTQSPATQSPSSSGEIQCTEAGFYPNPKDCSKFYRCVDNGGKFTVYNFDCPSGTIWDPSVETCNYPESVTPPRNCSTPQTTPAPCDKNNTTQATTDAPTTTTTTAKTTEKTEPTTTASTTTTEASTTRTTETTTVTEEPTTPREEPTQTTEEATTTKATGM